MTTNEPATGPADGRNPATGRFVKGNKLARGNPNLIRTGRLQRAVRRAVKPADIEQVLRELVRLATAGDSAAAKILLDRCLGRAPEAPNTASSPFPQGAAAPASIADVLNLQRQIVEQMAAGTVDTATANVTVGVLDRVRQTFVDAELEQRVARLEAIREDSSA